MSIIKGKFPTLVPLRLIDAFKRPGGLSDTIARYRVFVISGGKAGVIEMVV